MNKKIVLRFLDRKSVLEKIPRDAKIEKDQNCIQDMRNAAQDPELGKVFAMATHETNLIKLKKEWNTKAHWMLRRTGRNHYPSTRSIGHRFCSASRPDEHGCKL